MNWKRCRMKWPWPNVRHPSICLEEIRETTMNFSQDSKRSGLDTNRTPYWCIIKLTLHISMNWLFQVSHKPFHILFKFDMGNVYQRSRDSSVGTGYGLARAQRPDRLWGPSRLLSNEYRGFFPQVQSGRGVKLTTHLHLVPRSRMVELYLHSLIRLHGVTLN
jgi:hypothetical protein